MCVSQYDVVVVGAGCAGLTAAIGLARAGFAVAVVEAAPFAGAENWSGCVCFTENLAQPDLLGPDGVEALAWERRLIERGRFATDGRTLLGSTYRDADAFRDCFTVLRPIYDHHLSQIALKHGAALLTETTVESLIREGRRVIGVATQRGPLYADLVFLAEGDAAGLVSREGFQRSADPRDTPRFLCGVKQVIELPPGAIEERFAVGPEQGIAYHLLLRNCDRGTPVNARGLLYTNRQSLSVGLVLPAENLRHFDGEPGRLLEWLADMPALRPWWRDGRRGVWGAKLIRAGGVRDVPYLIEDGLAVGGAAAGVGVDFPVLNVTGPATATGLLLARAAGAIRAEGGGFHRDQLRRHYLEPLQQTPYWKDMEFLHRWPGYVRTTHVLFDHALDLLLDSAAIWGRPRRWLLTRWLRWCGLLARVRWRQWDDLRGDLRHLSRALRLREVAIRPTLGRLLLDGALNTFRDLARQPRPHLPPGGSLRIRYRAAGPDVAEGAPPFLLRLWFERFRPVLASAGHILYHNDDRSLSVRLTGMFRLLARQVNLLDLLAAIVFGFLTALISLCLGVIVRLLRPSRRRRGAIPDGLSPADTPKAVPANNLPTVSQPALVSPIHVVWKSAQTAETAGALRELTHVCPAGVFEVEGDPSGPLQVAVHFRHCIQCEACWRINPFADWGRDGQQRLIYPVLSPVVTRLLQAQDDAGLARPATPRHLDPWGDQAPLDWHDSSASGRLAAVLEQFEHKLAEFEAALAREPGTVDRGRADHLEMLARYAQQLAVRALEILQQEQWPITQNARRRAVLDLAAALAAKAEERTRRTWDGRFAWAAADGRQFRQHHLVGLRRLLGELETCVPSGCPPSLPDGGPGADGWRQVEPLRQTLLGLAQRQAPASAAVMRLLAEVATRCHLLETLAHSPAPEGGGEGPLRTDLLSALCSETVAVVAAQTTQLLSLLGPSEADLRKQVDRLSSWRPPGMTTATLYRCHGPRLLENEERLRAMLAVEGDWTTLAQRRALSAELEETQRAEARLAALACDWQSSLDRNAACGLAFARPGGANAKPQAAHAEIAEGFARQAAHLLAGKLLLLHTHNRLEQGRDTELQTVLLRVWLDDMAALLDEFASRAQQRLYPPQAHDDRPLVEPGAGPPPSAADYLSRPDPYVSGDFLMAPVDLLQARLVPEMIAGQTLTAIEDRNNSSTDGKDMLPRPAGGTTAFLSRTLSAIRERLARVRAAAPRNDESVTWRVERMEEAHYLADALAVEMIGRGAHTGSRPFALEFAAARLIVADLVRHVQAMAEEIVGEEEAGATLDQSGDAPVLPVVECCLILEYLAAQVVLRSPREVVALRHVGREALELEARTADFRQRLAAAWEVFGEGLWRNPSVQASCFALAEAAAWLKAADSTLGRMAWLSRLGQTEEGDEPEQAVGRRVLTRCHAEVRDRLHRFDEDLAALRRGYYAPHVRAAALLRTPRPEQPEPLLASRIDRPLRVLVVVEPSPAVLPAANGERVLETYWTLTDADRAALEMALRLRDAAPDLVAVQVVALGPRRVGQALREVFSLGIDRVRLVVQDNEAVTPERAATALAAALMPEGPFDLILGGDAPHREKRLAVLVAEALGIPLAGRAAAVAVDATGPEGGVWLAGPHHIHSRQRPLPAATLIEAGTALRPFTTAGYLAGLHTEIELTTV